MVVVLSGGPVYLDSILGMASAVVYAWYPGEQGGAAIASTLYGISNPSGRLPVTIPAVTNVLPHPLDQRMAQPPGMTYRFFFLSPPPPADQPARTKRSSS